MTKKTVTKIVVVVLILALITVLFTGCIPERGGMPSRPAGFFSGIWHGWIAPLSLVFSLFNRGRIYETFNKGFTYDLGFYMAIVSGFGGLGLTRKLRKDKD